MKSSLLFLVILLFALACQTNSSSPDRGAVMDSKEMAPQTSMEESQTSGGGTSPEEINVTEQKIIRNGNMTIKVKSALEAKSTVDALLAKHKAYAGNEQFDNSDYASNYYIQVRVPAENLDALVADLEKIDGTVTNKSINASDVTQEYIDLETRLANKRAYLEQYRQLLKNAKSIEDILKVREQIRQLEEEIESAEGRLKYLKNQVALSTLDLTLTQQKDFVYRPDRKINFWERLKDSISTGWYGFVTFCIYFLGLWPFWILLALIVWGARKFTKRKQKA